MHLHLTHLSCLRCFLHVRVTALFINLEFKMLLVEAISINEAEFSKLFNNQSFCDKHFSGKLVVFMIYALLLVLEQTYLAGN